MDNRNPRDITLEEFWRERSIRRAHKVLEATQKRNREELNHLISTIAQFVLPVQFPEHAGEEYSDIMKEALSRLGDEAFANWVLTVLHNQKP